MDARMRELSFKVVLLGEGRVGKTSLISRYVHNAFDEKEASTVQASMYSSKAVPINDASSAPGAIREVDLALWDTAGQERFHALAPMYYRNADGAIIVYDVTDADTLRKVRTWAKELYAVVGEGNIKLVLCGNKADTPLTEREVSEGEGAAMAAELGASHFFASAKTGQNVAEVFSAMATQVVRSREVTGMGGGVAAGGSSGSSGGGAYAGIRGRTPSRSRARRGLMVVTEDGEAVTPGRSSPSEGRVYGGITPPRAHRYGSSGTNQPITLSADDSPDAAAAAKSSGCC
ncbi:putative small GTPase [Leishmania infantum JPCM5]|uniref:Ras-related protein Rab-21 n=2 Tax=Leishmania infantum TaxID=5671 RepID=A0A6L0XI04_LEIIN|nr:putative small GTPase [Leishmania infantum JPCM5]CAC9485779.1 ras-related_protein_Rab21_-_putative [Leishmania infantum]CAM67813.1 putative small GTPase [Leishmania infantum JPCM5]SUZ41543.1 ras-related_protein_Rab21_-_putative [Leishmania infantum]|eukprot:XP_001465392.1 putative small GTPase [Leishmania infantum JPCM5]